MQYLVDTDQKKILLSSLCDYTQEEIKDIMSIYPGYMLSALPTEEQEYVPGDDQLGPTGEYDEMSHPRYIDICPCKVENGGSGICNCLMGMMESFTPRYKC